MNILFVCTWNVQRSKTAEDIFNKLIEGKSGFVVKSAGTQARPDLGGVQLTKEHLAWADKVFCFEDAHEYAIKKLDPTAEKKIIQLDVPDIYYRGDRYLVQQLEEKLGEWLTGSSPL